MLIKKKTVCAPQGKRKNKKKEGIKEKKQLWVNIFEIIDKINKRQIIFKCQNYSNKILED